MASNSPWTLNYTGLCSLGPFRFVFRNIEGSAGRRVITKPVLRGDVVSQDMGSVDKTFVIEGMFLQRDERNNPAEGGAVRTDPYVEFRLFEQYCNRYHPNGVRFTHPDFGDIDGVQIRSLEGTVSDTQGGVVPFRLIIDTNRPDTEFVLRPVLNERITAAADNLDEQATRTLVDGEGGYNPVMTIAVPRKVQASWLGDLDAFARQFEEFVSPLTDLTSEASRRIEEFRSAGNLLRRFTGPLENSLLDVLNVIEGYQGIVGGGLNPLGQLTGLWDLVLSSELNPSALSASFSDNTIANNRRGVNTYLVSSVLVQTCTTLVEEDLRDIFNSRDAAENLFTQIQTITNELKDQLNDRGALNHYEALCVVSAELAEYFDTNLPSLIRTRRIVLGNPAPTALNLQFSEAGDSDYDVLWRRNGSLSPLSMPDIAEV